jgi:tetratricopeptide (TPR) repeat protein
LFNVQFFLLGTVRARVESECYVPLYLRISAANVRLGGDPELFAKAMRSNRALDYLQSGADPTIGARSALALSYQSLPEPARQLFRILGRLPTRFVTPDSAAAILGVETDQSRWLLEAIADVHLIEQTGFGRYRLHDLVRDFAAEQDASADDDSAISRLTTFYVHAVANASVSATANEIVSPEPNKQQVSRQVVLDPHAAMAWLDSELPNIVTVVQHAADHGPGEAAWEISRRLTHYFWIRRSRPEWQAINEAALAAARNAGRPEAVASVLNALAVTTWTTNDLDWTRKLFEEALALNGKLGREAAQASNHTNLGALYRQTGHLREALIHTRTAIRLGRRHNRPLTVANALLHLGSLDRDFGALYEASRTVSKALVAYRTLGSTDGQVSSLNALAGIRCELGHFRSAETAAKQSLQMADAFGSVHGGVFAREAMADLLIATGRADEGRELSQVALETAIEQGDRRLIITATLRLAAALAAAKIDDDARHAAERARLLAIEQRDLHGQIDALLIMAQLPDEPGHALSLTRTAEREAALAGLRLREAKAKVISAEQLVAQGDAIDAREIAAPAWPILRRSGAKPWILRCLSVMRLGPYLP